jgi:hypothetical protein
VSNRRWTPLDEKAIAWWAEQNNAKIQPPFAWPQVIYTMPDGSKEIKQLIHLRVAYDKWRKENKRKKKEDLS